MTLQKQPKRLPFDKLEKAAECLRTMAHPHRLRMIQMLLGGLYTVGDLAEACGIRSHVASEHLRLMTHCGLLKPDKDGRKTYYKVTEMHLADLMKCIVRRFGEGE